MYTVKEIKQALLACKNLIELMGVMRVINYLSRSGDYNEEERWAIEAAAILKRSTFKFRY